MFLLTTFYLFLKCWYIYIYIYILFFKDMSWNVNFDCFVSGLLSSNCKWFYNQKWIYIKVGKHNWYKASEHLISPVGWGWEYTDCISAKGVKPHPNKCPDNDSKHSDGEAPVLKLLVITPRSTLLGVVVPVRVPSMGQIELFNHLVYLKPFNYVLKKMNSASF